LTRENRTQPLRECELSTPCRHWAEPEADVHADASCGDTTHPRKGLFQKFETLADQLRKEE